MEDKKTNGQQAEPAEGNLKDASPWLQEVFNTFSGLAAEMDEKKDESRALVTIAVHNDQAAVIVAGGGLPLARAVKEVLTDSAFAKHVANACCLIAAEAAEQGDGAIVIKVGNGHAQEDGEEADEAPAQDE